MKASKTLATAVAVACASAAGAALAGPSVYGLTSDQRLIQFRADALDVPQVVIGALTGFVGSDTALVGIDFRIQDGRLYGVGNAGGVYTINLRSPVLTFVNSLTVALSGTQFGVDFNPAANRLRVISDDGQNLRHDVAGTTLADTPLTNAGVAATGVTGAGYTNNDLDAQTGTLLYDIDTTNDQLSVQSPANSGTLAAIGKLGLDVSGPVGFDIVTRPSGTRAYAVFTDGASLSTFHAIDLVTGRATLIGDLDSTVIDIAVRPGS